MICKSCGAQSPDAPFCGQCGARQAGITLGELHEGWKKVHYRKLKSKSGIVNYEYAWKTLSVYENKAVTELTLEDYQAVMDTLADQSYSLQQKLLQLISQLCEFSKIRKIDTVNYAPFLVLEGYRSKSREIFSDEEIDRLFLYAKSGQRYAEDAQIVLILIFTGLRPEELFSVRRNQVCFQEHYFETDGSKTVAGKNRLIPIIAPIAPFILYWWLRHPRAEFLLPNTKNERMDLHNWRQRKFYPLMRELGICDPAEPHLLCPYCARHTFASVSKRAGVDKDTLTKVIGHANFTITEQVYIHETVKQLNSEMGKVAELVKTITA